MKKVIVNSGRSDSRFDIPKIEEKYSATYIGQHTIQDAAGDWVDDIVGDFFYQDNPPVGYSNYMVLYLRNGTTYISTGKYLDGLQITGIRADDGEIIYSRYRHDYRTSTDGSVWIDGGPSYVRGPICNNYVHLKIVDGQFYEVYEAP